MLYFEIAFVLTINTNVKLDTKSTRTNCHSINLKYFMFLFMMIKEFIGFAICDQKRLTHIPYKILC